MFIRRCVDHPGRAAVGVNSNRRITGGACRSTNSQHTSVGETAVRRFLQPVTGQDAPPELLPPELRDDTVVVPRRVDGRREVPPSPADSDPLRVAAGTPGAGA